MHFKRSKVFVAKEKGFTLVELIVVIAIIVLLVAIAVPSYINVIKKGKESILEANTQILAQLIALHSYDYEKTEWYDSWSNDGDGSLNNFMEQELEIINNGTYENNISLENPYSGKMSILDYDKTFSSGDGFCPAVFLTANQSYSHIGTGNTQNIKGSVVVYFKVSGGETEYIEIYYVKENGSKSSDSIQYGK